MRKITLAAVAASAIALAACGETAEPTEETTVVETDADMDTGMADAGETSVMDANTVTAEQLAGMDGVSPELADAIIAGQPYASVTDLNAVLMEGGDEAMASTMLETLFVPVNLNSASEEEIRLIPGMTDRMVREFFEYRPYEDMAEFDREIGKYVDEAEVARFRQYVTL